MSSSTGDPDACEEGSSRRRENNMLGYISALPKVKRLWPPVDPPQDEVGSVFEGCDEDKTQAAEADAQERNPPRKKNATFSQKTTSLEIEGNITPKEQDRFGPGLYRPKVDVSADQSWIKHFKEVPAYDEEPSEQSWMKLVRKRRWRSMVRGRFPSTEKEQIEFDRRATTPTTGREFRAGIFKHHNTTPLQPVDSSDELNKLLSKRRQRIDQDEGSSGTGSARDGQQSSPTSGGGGWREELRSALSSHHADEVGSLADSLSEATRWLRLAPANHEKQTHMQRSRKATLRWQFSADPYESLHDQQSIPVDAAALAGAESHVDRLIGRHLSYIENLRPSLGTPTRSLTRSSSPALSEQEQFRVKSRQHSDHAGSSFRPLLRRSESDDVGYVFSDSDAEIPSPPPGLRNHNSHGKVSSVGSRTFSSSEDAVTSRGLEARSISPVQDHPSSGATQVRSSSTDSKKTDALTDGTTSRASEEELVYTATTGTQLTDLSQDIQREFIGSTSMNRAQGGECGDLANRRPPPPVMAKPSALKINAASKGIRREVEPKNPAETETDGMAQSKVKYDVMSLELDAEKSQEPELKSENDNLYENHTGESNRNESHKPRNYGGTDTDDDQKDYNADDISQIEVSTPGSGTQSTVPKKVAGVQLSLSNKSTLKEAQPFSICRTGSELHRKTSQLEKKMSAAAAAAAATASNPPEWVGNDGRAYPSDWVGARKDVQDEDGGNGEEGFLFKQKQPQKSSTMNEASSISVTSIGPTSYVEQQQDVIDGTPNEIEDASYKERDDGQIDFDGE